MTIKAEAAFHEAGYAVIAYLSKFHRIVGEVNLASYGAGSIDVALSKSKCTAAHIPPEPSSARRPEVARDLGMILVAGLVAEQLAAERHSCLTATPACAAPDHQHLVEVLAAARLSRKFDHLEVTARNVLSENWPVVEALADFFLRQGRAGPIDVEEALNHFLSLSNEADAAPEGGA